MGKFELYKDKSGEWRFRLKAGNGEIIADSESYKTEVNCLNGVASLKKNVSETSAFEQFQDKADKWRFNIKAKNGEIIAKSEAYESKAMCEHGIESVKENAVNSRIISEGRLIS